jgi:uncharacterized glyoxalase superfamily protein PhnB
MLLEFPPLKDGDSHVESINNGCAKLMLDEASFIEKEMGTAPLPSNHSNFAIQYDSAEELNVIAEKLKKEGYIFVKEPWDAFWGQRYAVVKDPDGYMVDMYAYI